MPAACRDLGCCGATRLNQALGFSEAAFGLGAGLFFIAYFLFEVPSNIFLERVGARLWIARIMISWGIVSAAFAFIPSIAGATGVSAAAGIAAINSLGNLSGFAGPYAMGYLKDLTGNFTVGLLLLAGCAVIGAAVVVSLRIDARREQSSGEVALAH